MMRVMCAIVLIAFIAVSSIRGQDIDPEFIPTLSTTEGPEIDGLTTTTEINANIPDSTTIDVEETSDSTVETQTASTPTVGLPPIITTTEMIPETTTEAIVTSTTEAERTTTPITTTNVPTIATIPTERTPDEGLSHVICSAILRQEAPCFYWFYGVIYIPKNCYYCCHFIGKELGLQNCIKIDPYFCR